MIKSLSTPVILFFLAGPAMAQDPSHSHTKTGRGFFSDYHTVTLRLEYPGNRQTAPNPIFQHFNVIDARPDTARIGAIIGNSGSLLGSAHRKRQLVFGRSVPAELIGYLDKHYARPTGQFTALIVVRGLWLSEANQGYKEVEANPDLQYAHTRIRLKAEVYAEKNGVYVPLFRYDSALSAHFTTYRNCEMAMAGMLDELVERCGDSITPRWTRGRQLSWEQIEEFNNSRSALNILRDSTLVKGGYASFEEFKSNTPSITNYEIKQVKGALTMYIKQADGNSYYCHTAWGYCDGNTIYIMKDGELRPAWKEGAVFYFYATRYQSKEDIDGYAPLPPDPIVNTPGVTAGTTYGAYAAIGIGLSADQRKREKHIYQVDMETGKIY